jgi:hypothetical protein
MKSQLICKLKSPLTLFVLLLLVVALFTTVGPAEKSLGTNVRVVYLHGAWVWASLVAFFAAGVVGLIGLILRRQQLHTWSRALGRTGLFFWITYLPLSMWAMQTNWNGLFLAEPRWRLAVVFAIGGLVLQVGLSLVENPAWASAFNSIYAALLWVALRSTDQVMHPSSPVLDSDAWRIQVFFGGLVVLTLLIAWQVARWWHAAETQVP